MERRTEQDIEAHAMADVATANTIATRREGKVCVVLANPAELPALRRVLLVFINVDPGYDQSIVAPQP